MPMALSNVCFRVQSGQNVIGITAFFPMLF
jgi:hypothetical protein